VELTAGFKLSEAGPIPDDWDAVALGRVAAKTRNAIVGGPFGSDLTAEDYRDAGVPVIRGSNMHGRQVRGPFVYVEAAKAKSLEANLARPGDIVFTQRGTLGQVALVPFDGYAAYLVSQSQMKASLDPGLCNAEFLIHIFEQPEYQRKIVASAIQTGVPHLNLGILREYLLPRPPLPEQQAIAEVLRDVDAWIATAEAEAAKLASVKAAAMDALLSPTTRLPGFEGDWMLRPLGELYDFGRTVPVSRAAYDTEAGVACVHYGDIHVRWDGHLDLRKVHVPMASRQLVVRATRLANGDVLVADAAEDVDGVGKAVELIGLDRHEVVGGLHIQALRRKGDQVAVGFAGYMFQQDVYRRAVERAASGLKVFGISKSQLGTLEILLPPTLDEQRAITAVLADIDSALAAASAVVAKARGVKAAATDALLSGRIRLPLP
jgi:type I restriction enzyme S subunit